MTAQEVDYSKIEEIALDGIRLFKVMMRLEYALKDTGYAVHGQKQFVEVAWDQYANTRLDSTFWDKIKKAKEAEILILAPPKRQIVELGDNLGWGDAGPVSSIQELFGALRRVRNNLFHGGKSGDPDADRNAALYTAALFVIDQILQEDDILRTSFSGRY